MASLQQHRISMFLLVLASISIVQGTRHITGLSGSMSPYLSPSKYQDWRITVPEKHVVRITLTSISTYGCADNSDYGWLRVYDGPSSNKILSFCGRRRRIHRTATSTHRYVRIELRNIPYYSGRFNLRWQAIDHNKCDFEPCLNGAICLDKFEDVDCLCSFGYIGKYCQIVYEEHNGTLGEMSSVNYPQQYMNDFQQKWHIMVPIGSIIGLKFETLSFADDDYLTVYIERNRTEIASGNITSSTPANDSDIITPWSMDTANIISDNATIYYDYIFITDQIGMNMTTDHDETSTGFKLQWAAIDIDECLSDPCQNEGACRNEISHFVCQCLSGSIGETCQVGSVNEKTGLAGVVTSPGFPVGHPNNLEMFWRITAPDGYIVHIEIHAIAMECQCDYLHLYDISYNPFHHLVDLCQMPDDPIYNATSNTMILSMTTDGSYSMDGFNLTWATTDVNECLSDPCQNGGRCHDEINRSICLCMPGYTGTLCETDINECGSDPCHNDGTCTDLVDGYMCTCLDDYIGRSCDTVIQNINSTSGSLTTAGYGTNATTGPNEAWRIAIRPGWAIHLFSQSLDIGMQDTLRIYDGPDESSTHHDVTRNTTDLAYNSSSEHLLLYLTSEANVTSSEVMLIWTGHEIDECASSPCFHGGNCSDKNNYYDCYCPYGFSGKNCEAEAIEFSGSGGGIVSFDPNRDSSTYNAYHNHSQHIFYWRIEAPLGWVIRYRMFGVEYGLPPCRISPEVIWYEVHDVVEADRYFALCIHRPDINGVIDIESSFNFLLLHVHVQYGPPPPYFRVDWTLEDKNECVLSPCGHGGSCIDGIYNYTCVCPAGYTGIDCETDIDECGPFLCQHDGVCVDGIDLITCYCSAEYLGRTCTIPVEEVNGTSGIIANPGYPHNYEDNTEVAWRITAPLGSAIEFHHIVFSLGAGDQLFFYDGMNESMPLITNLNEDTTLENSYPTSGQHCVLLFKSDNGSTSVGFKFQWNAQDIDECSSDPCQHTATCSNEVNMFICTCPNGYTGIQCETEIDECFSQPCENGAECQDRFLDVFCVCRPGFIDKYCQTEIDECMSHPCLNGGRCQDEMGGFSCFCHHIYTGSRCQYALGEVEELTGLSGSLMSPRYPEPLLPNFHKYWWITIPQGWIVHLIINRMSLRCGSAVLDIFDGEDSNSSLIARLCTPPPSNIYTSTRHIVLLHLEVRSDRGTSHGFHITWNAIEKDDCRSAPCRNNGRCIDQHQGVVCVCSAGYKGIFCETDIDECSSEPCLRGGQCHDHVNHFTCTCRQGYAGRTCQILAMDACRSEPCENGGTCRTEGDSYDCVCPQLVYYGTRCEIVSGTLEELHGMRGILTSPNYNWEEFSNFHKYWLINMPRGWVVYLTVMRVELTCNITTLSIHDGPADNPATHLATLCSSPAQPDYTSTTDSMLLHLRSSGGSPDSGFTLHWDAVVSNSSTGFAKSASVDPKTGESIMSSTSNTGQILGLFIFVVAVVSMLVLVVFITAKHVRKRRQLVRVPSLRQSGGLMQDRDDISTVSTVATGSTHCEEVYQL